MTPELLVKIKALVKNGATVMGSPPIKSPSLVGYPECDRLVQETSMELWGSTAIPDLITERPFGEGRIIWGGACAKVAEGELYPEYHIAASWLEETGISEDFLSSGQLRYTHRSTSDKDIYFISNRSDRTEKALCSFRNSSGKPELWDPLSGETRPLSEFSVREGRTTIPLSFESFESYFVVFDNEGSSTKYKAADRKNFAEKTNLMEIAGPWSVSFDPKWGGPERITFDQLEDWTLRTEEGIKYYSGSAFYSKTFDLPPESTPDDYNEIFLDLGNVNQMARVWLNGTDLGVVWTAPWQVNVTDVLKKHANQVKIEVVNLWINRLIGDEQLPKDGVEDGRWPEWLVKGEPRPSSRFTFTTHPYYSKDAPLHPSGLLGPVVLLGSQK